jgi:putative transposase
VTFQILSGTFLSSGGFLFFKERENRLPDQEHPCENEAILETHSPLESPFINDSIQRFISEKFGRLSDREKKGARSVPVERDASGGQVGAWLYHRFCLSFRDVEDLLAERVIIVSYETIRLFVTIQGQRQYLRRAVDQDGDVIDILVRPRRDQVCSGTLPSSAVKAQGSESWRLVTDKLRIYGAAPRTIMPSVIHHTEGYANNRAEVSHEPTRQRKRQMRGFKSAAQAQRFLSAHRVIQNLFRVGRHLRRSANHRILRACSFLIWREATFA